MEDINTLTQKANSGDAVAMRKLGYEYLIGKNIQKDEKKAFQLFRAAVWEGDLNATIYCGYCCKTGAGLEKPNIVAAARYYEYGARAGVAAAQYELARMRLSLQPTRTGNTFIITLSTTPLRWTASGNSGIFYCPGWLCNG